MESADKSVLTDDVKIKHQQEVADYLEAIFGTPDKPELLGELRQTLDIYKSNALAGTVSSDASDKKQGLFREHCVHCHGITGDGKGSLARFLNPYPRDYRQGVFKFKTTDAQNLPSDADMMRILVDGINNTSMPSFRLLAESDRLALVEYVKYLTLRGRTETKLYEMVIGLDEEKEIPGSTEKGEKLKPDYNAIIKETILPLAEEWKAANETVINIADPPPPGIGIWLEASQRDEEKHKASLAEGRMIFFSKDKGSCFECHGPTAMGDGRTDVDDKWTEQIRAVRNKLKENPKQLS